MQEPISNRPIFTVQDIAVIGLSGRYPGARDVGEFWQHLRAGTNCVSEIPPERWDWRQFYDEERGKPGTSYSRWGGFLDDVDKFDPLFFQISPREAESMDPQERLFLETVYASIEDAGYTSATLCTSRKVGVFVGVMHGTYSRQPSHWSIANRVSYLFDFHGPSMAINSACSASLTAIHLALESLYVGSSECAIAGGVNLILNPVQYLTLANMSVLSAGGTCRVFGAGADGLVAGEGVGAVLLKPLDKAIADGDHIYGVLKGSMVNAGGKTNGYTVPNPKAQAQVIVEALERAGVSADTVSYVEAHGTGTALGDPIEISGLTQAFERHTQKKQFCAIGSVKSNIGHSESAAGIAGLTKSPAANAAWRAGAIPPRRGPQSTYRLQRFPVCAAARADRLESACDSIDGERRAGVAKNRRHLFVRRRRGQRTSGGRGVPRTRTSRGSSPQRRA